VKEHDEKMWGELVKIEREICEEGRRMEKGKGRKGKTDRETILLIYISNNLLLL